MNKSTYIKTEFRDSFLKILKTKSIDKISVTEISTVSGYSRQTFYRYFDSIDDLIWFIHEDNVVASHKIMLELGFSLSSLKLYLDLILHNKNFYKQAFTGEQNEIFINAYVKRTKINVRRYFLRCEENAFSNNQELLFSLDFYTYSFSYTIIEWVKNNCEMTTSYLSKSLIENMPENLKDIMIRQLIKED